MSAQLARKITAEDIYKFKLVSDPIHSPATEAVAYVTTTIQKEADGYHSSICIVSTEKDARTLTRAKARDSRPQWSPDGNTIAFISDRSEKRQVWMIRVTGGEAWQLTEFDDDVTDFCWSPDGRQLAVVTRQDDEESSSSGDDEEEEEKSDVKHITQIRYKSDDEGFLDPRPRNIWNVNVDGSESRQLTHSDVHD
ncbi:MAG: S9 family peptidase, partial [Chloroflexota bacterium]